MKNNNGNGIKLGAILFVVFLILKLCKIIAWSWVWIFAPLWIPLALGIALVLIGILLNKFNV